MRVSCQTPHQLCDPKLVVSKLNSLNIIYITTPVSDRTAAGDLTESNFCLVLLCDSSFKRRDFLALSLWSLDLLLLLANRLLSILGFFSDVPN